METVPSRGFRRLAYSAALLTFLLIIVGGIVRISDSGLGCGPGGSGTKGWPLCGGRVVPLIDANMIIEYSHRILAGSLAVVIGLLVYLARRHLPRGHALRRVTVAAFGLVLFQAALGGLTVEKGLEEELVAAHLGVAMLQLGLLLLIAFLTTAQPRSQSGLASLRSGAAAAPPAVRLLSVLTTLAVLGTIVAGGYMSANELHGTGEHARAVHMACGKDFPSCQGEFLPFGRTRDLDIHLTHRAFMYVASALMLLLFVTTVRRVRLTADRDGRIVSATAGAFAVFVTQVLLGALNVWLGEHAWLVILHLTTGTLLWCSLVYLSLLVLRGREQAAPAPREATIEAAPA